MRLSFPLGIALGIAGLGCWLLAACQTEPLVESVVELEDAVGRLEVELLDHRFLSCNGERLAIDEFVYRMRLRARAKEGAKAATPAPAVRLLLAGEGVPPGVWKEFMKQLRLAGIQHIELGS